MSPPTSSLAIQIGPSPRGNDHQVRFLIDGDDLIASQWDEMIGLDPDQILLEPCDLLPSPKPTRVTVARCSCGDAGCGSEDVVVGVAGDAVEWEGQRHDREGTAFVFRLDRQTYEMEVRRAMADTAWETPGRTAARLVRLGVDREVLGNGGFHFDWASPVIRSERLTACLTLGPYQILVNVPLGGESPAASAEALVRELRRRPKDWTEVEWIAAPKVPAPRFCGPGWRRGPRA